MTLPESRLNFIFDDNHWTDLVKFDEHPDYEKVKKNVSETKAVDFIGILNQKSVYFFEIKNLKDYRIDSKKRLNTNAEDLTNEIAQKVRDSIACIVGGCRNSTNDKELWNNVLRFLSTKNIFVILWLEQDDILNKDKFKISNYQLKLQSKLKWLTGMSHNIRIYNKVNYNNGLKMNVLNL